MVQMFFYIRFYTQLRRTRPRLVASLESAFSRAVAAAGGRENGGRQRLAASFDDSRIGFWLDMAMLLEGFERSLGKASPELSGHAIVLCREFPGEDVDWLCRELASSALREYTGIWCAQDIRAKLEPYGEFTSLREVSREDFFANPGGPRGLAEYGELKTFKAPPAPNMVFPYQDKIERALAQGGGAGILILGPEFMGKRNGVYRYCAGLMGETAPLVVRFGVGGRGVACFADALDGDLRAFLAAGEGEARKRQRALEELDALQARLFRERLRDEVSPLLTETGRRFLTLLLTLYQAAAGSRYSQALVILDNPQLAEDATTRLFREVVEVLKAGPGETGKEGEKLPGAALVFVGICDMPATEQAIPRGLRDWGLIFPLVLKFTDADAPALGRADLPLDVWEAAYATAVLSRYFPLSLVPQLFEEEGLNRRMPAKATDILMQSGLANPGDQRPRITNFVARAERVLGVRAARIQSMAQNRLLAWIDSGRLSPCFDLLRIFADLGGRVGDALTLRAIAIDVYNGTFEAIEGAVRRGRFTELAGTENGPVLIWIFRTLKALVHGGVREIREAFAAPVPAGGAFEGLRGQIQANLAAYHLGRRDFIAAAEPVKEALYLNKTCRHIPACRLFSLASIFRQKLDDAVEYSAFAMEQAEQIEDDEELVKACYSAGGIHLLYGSLAKAGQYAARAEERAESLGRAGWAARARFLRGRVAFELGRYRDALELFESLRDAGATAASSRERTVDAWIYRARVFIMAASGGKTPPLRPAGASLEARLFEVEAAYLAGRDREALTLADEALAPPPGDDAGAEGEPPESREFFFTEQPDWRSGFAQCEDMIIPVEKHQSRLVTVYRAMAQARLAGSVTPELRTWMEQFIRQVAADGDPNDSFYYYAWYCVLRDGGAPAVDMSTAVSMAFNRFQRRARRISDLDARQAFTQAYWNDVLAKTARDHMLV